MYKITLLTIALFKYSKYSSANFRKASISGLDNCFITNLSSIFI